MAESDLEVVKWYTSARKVPSVIGRTKDGTRIPFGPFKVSAVLTTVGIFVAGNQLLGLGLQSGATPWITVAVVAIGAGALVTKMPTDGRNPLNVVSGAINQTMAPRTGRIDGKPIRISRPHVAYAKTLISLPVVAPAAPQEQAVAPEPVAATTTRTRREHVPAAAAPAAEATIPLRELLAAPALAAPALTAPEAPVPGSVPRRSITALSGVQQLLANLPSQE